MPNQGSDVGSAKATDILKQAILLERRGQAFYQTAAEQTKNTAVKEFFTAMAKEEAVHISILSSQYREYLKTGQFLSDRSAAEAGGEVAERVLSEELKGKISAADFEAAAISAAMAMEERAIKLYVKRAAETEDAEEKALYEWLSKWETGHLEMLAAMDRDLTEEIWNDNNFWPF